MIGVEKIGEIRRAYFEQHRSIKEIVRTLSVSRATVRKVVRGHQTEFKYERGVQPAPRLGDWVEVLTEILEQEAKLPKRERRSTQRLFEELRGRGYDGAHDSVHRFVKAWRNERVRVPVHAYVPMSFAPGEAYQFDWSGRILRCLETLVAQRRSRHRQQRADSPRRETTLPAVRNLLSASRHAHQFFAATSFITSISRSRSAQLLQPRILGLELLQAPDVVRSKAAETLAPGVDRLLANTVPLGDHRHLIAIRLADDRNHLLFRETRFAHCSLRIGSQSLTELMVRNRWGRSLPPDIELSIDDVKDEI
jgi:hypothetical protein